MSQAKTAKIVLIFFFLTSLAWSVFTPVFEAPDETTAYEYGRYYARTWQLPVITKLSPPQGVHHWEPLYFIFLGRIAKTINAPLSDHSRYHYPAGWTRIREENPANLYRHEPDEFKFGWDKLATSLHLMRLFSVFLASGSVWFVYKTGREIFSQKSWLPIWAMILYAFNPQFVFFSGILNVVNMITFLTAVFLWLLTKYLRRGQNDWRHTSVLGCIFGIAIFSKMTALAMLPATLLAVGWKRMEERKSIIRGLAIFLLAFLVTGGWYLIRNQVLYGEFSGTKAHVVYRFGRVVNPFLEEVGLVNFIISYPKTQWITLWSGFGWITVYLPLIFPLAMLVFYAHGLFGFVGELTDGKLGLNRVQRRQLIILGLMPVSVWLGITRVIFMVEVFHGKDLFLITGVLTLMVVVGWASLWKRIESGGWLGKWEKLAATGAMGVLTSFWLKQPQLAKLVKGIAGGQDVLELVWTAAAGMTALVIGWRLIENKILMKKVARFWASREGILLSGLAGLLVVANLMVLFMMFIQAMYHLSIWELLKS